VPEGPTEECAVMLRFLYKLFGVDPGERTTAAGSPRLARPALQQLEPRHLPYAGVLGAASGDVAAPNSGSDPHTQAGIRSLGVPAYVGATLPGFSAGGPPEVARRATDVSFPTRVRAGKTYNLRVHIAPDEERPHPHDDTLALEVHSPPVKVAVSVTAENFEIDGPAKAEITLQPGGKATPVSFSLRGQKIGPGRVIVDFTQDGRSAGWVDLTPQVVGGTDVNADAGTVDWEGTTPSRAAVPDVILKVFEHHHTGAPGRLHFVLSSVRPDLQD